MKFKNICYSPGGILTGLTPDGEIYTWTVSGWRQTSSKRSRAGCEIPRRLRGNESQAREA